VSPKVISERIGHANVGFFLETYAHVLGDDDREAADQAASFLLGDDWKPEEQPDEHRERVLALVEAKASGKQIVQAQADEPGDSSDLLAALEASIKGSRKGKG